MARRHVSRPPGPPGPAFALGRLLRRDPTSAFERLAHDHPRLAYLRLGREHVYVLNHPDLVTSLFLTHGRATRKGRTLQKIRVLLGDGLLTSEGDLHRRQRRLIQPALHERQVQAYADTMTDAALELSGRWRDGATVDLAREMSALTLAVVGGTLFGRRLSGEAAEIASCMDILLSGYARHLLPGADLLLSLPTRRQRRMFAAVDRLDALVRRLVAERRAALAGSGTPDRQGSPLSDVTSAAPGDPDTLEAPDDLLSVLVSRMDDRQARDEAMTLLLAGHETTANALTWTWWLLDRHPDVAAWWHEEIDSAAHSAAPALSHADISRTRAVLAEAMRLYPPSWVLGRRLLRPIELDGWTVPAGSLCVASQWAMHRDPRFWPDRLEFCPTRWLSADVGFDESAPGHPRGAYLPFGLGARVCAGRWFAWTEGVLLLATLGRTWAPRAVPGHPVEPLPAITLRPRYGMRVTLHRRAG